MTAAEIAAAEKLVEHLPSFNRPAIGSVLGDPTLQYALYRDAVEHLETGDDAGVVDLSEAMGVLGARRAWLASRLGP